MYREGNKTSAVLVEDEILLYLKIDKSDFDSQLPALIQNFFDYRMISNNLTSTFYKRLKEEEGIQFSFEFNYRVEIQSFDELYEKVASKMRGFFNLDLGFWLGICYIGCENCELYDECENEYLEECMSKDLCHFKPDWEKEGMFLKKVENEE
jgi:hypothetical protein